VSLTHIGVDLDSVMFDFPRAVSDLHHEDIGVPMSGEVVHWDDVLTHSIFSDYKSLFDWFAHVGGWQRTHLPEYEIEQSHASVGLLLLQGFNVTFVTSRTGVGSHVARDWHERSMFAAHSSLVTDAGHDKHLAAPACHVFVDDSPHVLDAVSDAGVPVICFDQPWNRLNPLHERAQGWPDVLKLLSL
jgi:hypothetical protein